MYQGLVDRYMEDVRRCVRWKTYDSEAKLREGAYKNCCERWLTPVVLGLLGIDDPQPRHKSLPWLFKLWTVYRATTTSTTDTRRTKDCVACAGLQ